MDPRAAKTAALGDAPLRPDRPVARSERSASGPSSLALPGDDALSEFLTEAEIRSTPPVITITRKPAPVQRPPAPRIRPLAVGVAIGLVGVAIAGAVWKGRSSAPPVGRPATGTLSIESTPPAARVLVDGQDRGATPLTLGLAPGTHQVVLRAGDASRELSVSIAAGSQVVHHVEIVDPSSAGRLSVPGPEGASVVLDGTRRGIAPIEFAGIPAGVHSVTVGDGSSSVSERVSVPAGGVATFVVPSAQGAGPAPAWVSVLCPVDLQVFDGNSLIGTSGQERILVLSGRHALRLVNASLDFQATRTVQVEAGRTSIVRVDLPNGRLSVNALPWAVVLLDGKPIGETPIANLEVPIGPHEITLRNPKFPERKHSVIVTVSAPARVGVDLRQ